MSASRRTFLKISAGAAGLILAGGIVVSRALQNREILVNQVGFVPGAAKFCLLKGRTPVDFSVVNATSGEILFRGTMNPGGADLGEYVVGDFSALNKLGPYQIQAAGAESAQFVIAPDIYDSALRKCAAYFSKQRCGDSKTGYHAPCHLDDGRRADNGQPQDVTGGWHDACDVRKWVNATLYGMTGLYRTLDTLGDNWQRAEILEELRWGNQYFLKMQEPAGYVMDYCGGDDGNNWTDNIRGSFDDRVIHTDACELPSQFHFVAVQAAMSRLTQQEDAPYSRKCLEAAHRCLAWCLTTQPPNFAPALSMAIMAAVELHRAAGGNEYDELVASLLKKLLNLQGLGDPTSPTSVRGYFLAQPDDPEPFRAIMHGNLPLLALCQALEHLPDHPDAATWRQRMRMHVEFLMQMSGRAAFGTVPFGLYLGQDPGGNRRVENFWYRWFMRPKDEHPSSGSWWVGINAHLASNGVGFIKAARLLRFTQLSTFAQRQLDWILGVNPFAASTISDVGRGQPPIFQTDEFRPPTPLIPGGVTNGIGGSAMDEAVLNAGSYNTCEYWTPMTAYTLWLLAEIQIGT